MATATARAKSPKRYARDYKDIPAVQAVCRAVGHKWAMNDIVPGKPLPRGLRSVRQADGSSRLTDTCKRGCGKQRTISTFPGGVFDADAPYGYTQTRDWVTLDEGFRPSPREILAGIMMSVELTP